MGRLAIAASPTLKSVITGRRNANPSSAIEKHRPRTPARPGVSFDRGSPVLGRNYILAVLCTAALLGCAATGCSSKSKFKFDQMDIAPAVEELAEFPLGEYKIPIPVAVDDGAEGGKFAWQPFAVRFPAIRARFAQGAAPTRRRLGTTPGGDSRQSDQYLPQCVRR